MQDSNIKIDNFQFGMKVSEENQKVSELFHLKEAEFARKSKEYESQIQYNLNQLALRDKEIQEMQKKLAEANERVKREMSKQKDILSKQQTISAIHQQPASAIEIIDSQSIRDLEKIEDIGFGNGGKVMKVAMKKFYALKEMNIQNASFENLQHFVSEYEIMNMLNHPNILKTHGIFFSDEKIPPSILLEYCPINLEQAIKRKTLSKIQLVYFIYQIAEGMKYVHFRKIIHRDLKPSNILVSEDGMIKICDFGISRLMTAEEQSMTRGLGTQKYMAPEIINEEQYNEKVDVYSFGVIVYFMMSGGELPGIKIRDICTGKNAPIPTTFSLLARQMIEACWSFDPKYRPRFGVICEILESNGFNLASLSQKEIQEVSNMIFEYKKLIPAYSE